MLSFCEGPQFSVQGGRSASETPAPGLNAKARFSISPQELTSPTRPQTIRLPTHSVRASCDLVAVIVAPVSACQYNLHSERFPARRICTHCAAIRALPAVTSSSARSWWSSSGIHLATEHKAAFCNTETLPTCQTTTSTAATGATHTAGTSSPALVVDMGRIRTARTHMRRITGNRR